jgi:hypothetical protein
MEKKNKKNFSLILRIILVSLIFILLLKGVAFLVILIALSIGLSFIINNFPIRNIGLELVTFIAVLSGLKYGPWIALGITFILITYHMVAGGFLDKYVLWVIPAYCLAAVISGFMPATDVVQLGIYATFAINISNSLFTLITSPSYLPRYLIYAVTNILFNIFLFTFFGMPILLLIR